MGTAETTLPLVGALALSPLLPWIGALHIVGLAMLVGAVTIFDLRVLGLGRSIPVRALARLCLPWSVLSLVLVVPSGSLLFLAHADVLLTSRLFLLKMGLLLVAAITAIAFHAGPYGSVDRWSADAPAPLLARLLAATSIAVWVAVILVGRMVAD